jgi:ABC-type antimicrobial peptide transport system permease subunit
MPGTIKQQINLPFKEAVRISIRSLWIRLGRSFITTAGIFFAISFLTAIFTSGIFTSNLAKYGSVETQVSLQFDQEAMMQKQVWLVVLSLIVSGVGITNAMLMSVTERYKEIGTMKCLGALDRFIIELFILESAFQGIIGSFVGAIVGFLIMLTVFIIRFRFEVFFQFPTMNVLLAITGSFIAGIILSIAGAIYPAYKAAQMLPADAMRREI